MHFCRKNSENPRHCLLYLWKFIQRKQKNVKIFSKQLFSNREKKNEKQGITIYN